MHSITENGKRTFNSAILLALLIFIAGGGVTGQDKGFDFGKGFDGSKQDGIPNTFEDLAPDSQVGEAAASFSSNFLVYKGTKQGKLRITCVPDSATHSHVYSQRTDLPDQVPTQFLIRDERIKLTGSFVPDLPPKKVVKKYGDITAVTEEFATEVTWSAPFEFVGDVDPEKIEIKITAYGQACNLGGCTRYDEKNPVLITSKFADVITGGPFRAGRTGESDKVEWTASVSHTEVKPGEKFTVTFTAKVDDQWYIYSQNPPADPEQYSPTLILFSQTSGLRTGDTTPQRPAERKNLGEIELEYFAGEVTFTTDLTVPNNAKKGQAIVNGKLGYQNCTTGICQGPTVADFAFTIQVGDQRVEQAQAVEISESSTSYAAVSEIAEAVSTIDGKQAFQMSVFLQYCGIAFLAGLLLNVMPCVLPVIGLKMISFLEQSGESRARIFALNMSYSFGLITVFWFLAVLVVVLGMGWGEFMNSLPGVIVASGIVFAFGLSMVGVWEIPIPGFASSTSASKLAEKEGLGGAFTKGALTTVLATPCVGPLLIPAMTFAVSQTTFLAFVLFTVLGIGMASPFIALAFFPSAVKLLPKPGPWMETFKQLMGFTMIATVIFLLNTFSRESPNAEYLMSVLTMLMSVAVGCWWIGRTSIIAETSEKMKAYGAGVSIIAVGTLFAFSLLAPSSNKLDWQDYSDVALKTYRMDNRPVFIDFTGPACPTCQLNEATALNILKTKRYFEENEIVAIRADISDKAHGDDIERLLKKLGNKSKGIPFYAFFPPGGGPPVVRDGLITAKLVRETFEEFKTVESEPVSRLAGKPDTRQP